MLKVTVLKKEYQNTHCLLQVTIACSFKMFKRYEFREISISRQRMKHCGIQLDFQLIKILPLFILSYDILVQTRKILGNHSKSSATENIKEGLLCTTIFKDSALFAFLTYPGVVASVSETKKGSISKSIYEVRPRGRHFRILG